MDRLNEIQALVDKTINILLYEEFDKGNMQRLEVLMRNIQLLRTGE